MANACVHATSESRQPIIIVFPHEIHLRDAIKAAGNAAGLPSADSDIHKLCDDPKIQAFILKDLQSVAKKNGFKTIEVVQGVVLAPDEWTPENGLVTAAQKVQRKNVEKAFKDQITVSIYPGSSSFILILFCGSCMLTFILGVLQSCG